MITSVHNSRIKETAQLRDRKARRARGQFLIDGRREIGRALDGGLKAIEAYYLETAECAAHGELQRLLERLFNAGAELIPVSAAPFSKLAYGDRNEGIVVAAATRQTTLADLMLPPRPIVAVLDDIEKPGNVGAVLRSADAAGVAAVIATHPFTDIYNPNAIRASLGAVFTTPVVSAAADEALRWLDEKQLPIFAARVEANDEYHRADFSQGAALVLGAESSGLAEVWNRETVRSVRLPMLGAVDSLNVSAAAAVLFYEALRQRSAALG